MLLLLCFDMTEWGALVHALGSSSPPFRSVHGPLRRVQIRGPLQPRDAGREGMETGFVGIPSTD